MCGAYCVNLALNIELSSQIWWCWVRVRVMVRVRVTLTITQQVSPISWCIVCKYKDIENETGKSNRFGSMATINDSRTIDRNHNMQLLQRHKRHKVTWPLGLKGEVERWGSLPGVRATEPTPWQLKMCCLCTRRGGNSEFSSCRLTKQDKAASKSHPLHSQEHLMTLSWTSCSTAIQDRLFTLLLCPQKNCNIQNKQCTMNHLAV